MPLPTHIPIAQAWRRRLERYGPLSEETFTHLCAIAEEVDVRKGEVLLQEGEVARLRYYVQRGLIISQYHGKSGSVHYKNLFTEDNFAGSVASALTETPSRFSLRALEDSRLVAYDSTAYRRLVSELPDLNHFYLRHLEDSWIIENERRQMAFATQTAAERYADFLAEHPTLEQRVPQHVIAAYLGITPTQLSRVRGRTYANGSTKS